MSLSDFRLRIALVTVAISILSLATQADDAKPTTKAADSSDSALKEEMLKFNRAGADDAQREKLRAFVKDKDRAKKGVMLAIKLQKAGKEDKPFNFNGSLLLARAAQFLKQLDVAEYFYDYAIETATKLESGEKMVKAFKGMASLYSTAKRYQDLVDLCEKFVEINGDDELEGEKVFMYERLVKAKALQGNYDEALRINDWLTTQTKGTWFFIETKGWILREAGKFGEAIETYNEALEKIDADKKLKKDIKDQLKDDVRYTMSGIFVDNNEIDKAAKQLEILIKRDPENPTYKNDLGFIWADHDLKLDESEKLIREALDLDKKMREKLKEEGKLEEVTETAAYLDSLGWVLFKKKKFKEALPYLIKASKDEDEGAHLEIWDHLADVYAAMENKTEAIAAWQKGLSMEDVSKRDEDRRKKVVAKLKAFGVEAKLPEPKKEAPKKKKID